MISGFGGKREGDDGNIIHLSIFAWNEKWHGREGARDKKNEGRALDLYAKGFKMFLIPFFGMLLTQRPRMRQFCVDIALPFNWRNIDAALLREHSLRRYCAYYKFLQICANLTHASTHASFLRKKLQKNNWRMRQKK